MIDFDPDKITHRLIEAGEDWAEKDAAASLLEETKKTILAELMLKAEGSAAAREMTALADPIYRIHVTNMVAARKEANKARVKWESGRAWVELRRSLESTRRAEMGMR